jgi:hypothetical protein
MVRKECHAEIRVTVLVTNDCKDKQQLHELTKSKTGPVHYVGTFP